MEKTKTDDNGLKVVLGLSGMLCLFLLSSVAGCTYTTDRRNAMYHEAVIRCINAGGTFIPTADQGHGKGACLMR